MRKSSLILIVLFAGLCAFAKGQNRKKIDSLLSTLSKPIHDTDKVKSYVMLYNEYKSSDQEKALGFIHQCIALSKKHDFKKGLQLGYINKSVTLYGKGQYDSALKLCTQAVALHSLDTTLPKRNLGLAHNILGVIRYRQGDFREALTHFLSSVRFFEESGQKANTIHTLNNISVIYLEQKNYKKALDESRKCSRLCIELKNTDVLASTYQNQANIFNRMGLKDSVVPYYEKSIALAEKDNKPGTVAHALTNIGGFYTEIKNYKKGIEYLLKAVKMNEKLQDPHAIAETQVQLGNSYLQNKDYKESEYYLTRAETNMKALGVPRELSQVYELQSALYEAKGMMKQSLEKYKLFKLLNDSVFNASSSEHINEVIAKYDSDKKDREITLLGKEKALQESEIMAQKAVAEKQNIILMASLGGLLVVMILAVVLFRGYKQKQKINKIIEGQKLQVEEKNKSITDSINYAKRIQEAILPGDHLFDSVFSDHFILLKPKDIVSGDFYWAHEHDDRFYLAVCDSTGHGVPGAFMSVMNISFLNEAVVEKNIPEPNKVLDYVRGRLVSSMSKEDQKDGFDGTLICYNKKTGEINYASANSKPILISNGAISELPTDKMPVGKGERNEPFSMRSIDAKKGDIVYIYTDGFADQFGGPHGKKFKYKQLSELILNSSGEPLLQQKELLNQAFEGWRQNLEQIDDVCVIAIKI